MTLGRYPENLNLICKKSKYYDEVTHRLLGKKKCKVLNNFSISIRTIPGMVSASNKDLI